MATTTDYDAPRNTITEDESLEHLQARRGEPNAAAIDADENDLAASFALPGADQLDEELSVAVVPMKTDEFRCTSCFMVWHRSQQAATAPDLCRDCA